MNDWLNWALRATVTLLPFLVLLAFWVYFAKRMRRQAELIERSFQHMERVETLLERIAQATEKAGRA